MASLRDLPGAAETLLSAFAAKLEAIDGFTVPQRRYRAPGALIVWDGEQMTVAFMGLHQGQPGAAIGTPMVPSAVNFSAQFSVSLIRAVSSLDADKPFQGGAIPSADEMDADGVSNIGDAGALVLAATEIQSQYLAASPGEGFVIDGMLSVGPEGGLAGQRLLISLSVD